MKRLLVVLSIAALVGFCLPTMSADDTSLQEILFNVNGSISDFGGAAFSMPGLTNGFNSNGIGTLTIVYNPGTTGAHFFDVFMDYELHAPFFNESGEVSGSPDAGQTWQIDEPGFGDANRLGTIFTNANNNAFDNTNWIPGKDGNFDTLCGANAGGGNVVNPNCNNDVSLGMGFNFILGAGEQATIHFHVSHTVPRASFYLHQIDPDTPSDLYLTGDISIGPGGPQVIPEPGTWLLAGTALVFVVGLRRRFAKN
jgi:hypothetical protein